MKQYYKGYGYRDNPTYPPYDCMTLTRCEKCGELYEADKEHVCLRKNSYPWDMMTDAGEKGGFGEMTCKYCQNRYNGETLKDEYGKYEAIILKRPPLVDIDCKTWEVKEINDAPYFSLYVLYGDSLQVQSIEAEFTIKFCPMCGRKLELRKEVNSDGNIDG